MTSRRNGGDEINVWQAESHPEQVYSEVFYQQKLDYIHKNPVKQDLSRSRVTGSIPALGSIIGRSLPLFRSLLLSGERLGTWMSPDFAPPDMDVRGYQLLSKYLPRPKRRPGQFKRLIALGD